MAVNHEDRMVPATLPSSLGRGAAPGIEAIAVAGRVTAIGRPVWGARLGGSRERRFAALRDPDAVWRFGKDATRRPPGPSGVVRTVKPVRPILDQFKVTIKLLAAFFLRLGGYGASSDGQHFDKGDDRTRDVQGSHLSSP